MSGSLEFGVRAELRLCCAGRLVFEMTGSKNHIESFSDMQKFWGLSNLQTQKKFIENRPLPARTPNSKF